MDSLGVGTVVMIGTPAQLAELPDRPGTRILRSLLLPCVGGRMPNAGIPCYAGGGDWPPLDSVRALITSGRIQMLGEISTQYLGLRVDDPRLEPYLALAEELGVPVGMHLGIGPPGISYADTPSPPYKSPDYSGAAGDPLALEAVLRKHPRLRVYVMHAAWPWRDAMLYLLYMHPRLHVDVSVLQYGIPRPAYEDYLRDLVHAGFARRIMFGSDGSARRVREGIEAIRAMSFLTEEQKADILGGNAGRFFRKP
jgi:predicted TIM-barrel fold metal-dependent hydrolase